MPLAALAATLALSAPPGPVKPHNIPRFELQAPCPTAPAVMIDTFGTGLGLASETAKAHQWQGRILWIDATANIDRYNTPEKIDALTTKIAESGFNTVVFDVKPISGQTVYPSKYNPKLTEWRGQTLPADFDPVPSMVENCHRKGLSVFASMNAFSEGHRLFKVGPGYNTPEHQTLIYEPNMVVRTGQVSFPVAWQADQPQPDALVRYSSAARLPRGGFGVTIVDGFVVSQGDADHLAKPSNGFILYGVGEAATFARTQLTPCVGVRFDTVPTYVPIGTWAGAQIPLMMDPNDPEVQDHALDIIREVVGKYNFDGVIYDDRLRYSGINGDFSNFSRTKFEQSVGQTLHWPDDVFKFTVTPGFGRGIQPGPYYDAWIAWRARQIQTFVSRVRNAIRQTRVSAQLGVYVGSWYGDYPALGHNYASPSAEAGFWFLTPSYQAAGTAPLMDFLICGCYYPTPTIYDAMERGTGIGNTVEASGTLVNRLVRAETWCYAGIDCGDFDNNPAGLGDAVQAACASTEGVMVFDLSHDMDSKWDIFAQLFKQRRLAPHQAPGSAVALRKHRALVDRFHQQIHPIIIAAGSSGTGQ